MVLNIKIIWKSRRLNGSNSHNIDFTLAKIMMSIVFVFIVLHFPKMIMALYEVNQISNSFKNAQTFWQVSTIPDIFDCYRHGCLYYVSSSRWIADHIIRYLVMLNSSVNFIIYCFVGSNFRETLFKNFEKLVINCQSSRGSPNMSLSIMSRSTETCGVTVTDQSPRTPSPFFCGESHTDV